MSDDKHKKDFNDMAHRDYVNIGNTTHHVRDGVRHTSHILRGFTPPPIVDDLEQWWGTADALHALFTTSQPTQFSSYYPPIKAYDVAIRRLFFQYLLKKLSIPPFVAYLAHLFELTLQTNIMQRTHPQQMGQLRDIAGDVGSLDIEKYFLSDAFVTGTVFAFIPRDARDTVMETYKTYYVSKTNAKPNQHEEEQAQSANNTPDDEKPIVCPAPQIASMNQGQKDALSAYVPDFSSHRDASPTQLLSLLRDSLFYSEQRMYQTLAQQHPHDDDKTLLAKTLDQLVQVDNLYMLLRGKKAFANNQDPEKNIRYYDLLWGYGNPSYEGRKKTRTLCLGAPAIQAVIEAFSIGLEQHENTILAYFQQQKA